jgi:hypothetical protein
VNRKRAIILGVFLALFGSASALAVTGTLPILQPEAERADRLDRDSRHQSGSTEEEVAEPTATPSPSGLVQLYGDAAGQQQRTTGAVTETHVIEDHQGSITVVSGAVDPGGQTGGSTGDGSRNNRTPRPAPTPAFAE